MSIIATKVFEFEAAHKLPHYDGACANLHGHTYKLEVSVVKSDILDGPLDENGFVMDFSKLKEIVNKYVVNRLDHSYLNEEVSFDPTAEGIINWIWGKLSTELYPYHVRVYRLRLWETSTSYIEMVES